MYVYLSFYLALCIYIHEYMYRMSVHSQLSIPLYCTSYVHITRLYQTQSSIHINNININII